MIIRDKQDLRKCVKQSVRRAHVLDTGVKSSVVSGSYGVANWLSGDIAQTATLQDAFMSTYGHALFASRPAELFAALDAMNLPVHDLDKAQMLIDGMDCESYLSSMLDALRARQALVEVNAASDDMPVMPDHRFAPLIVADASFFVPGRYGVDYAACAQRLEQSVLACGAKHIRLQEFDRDALAYCMIPVCEDCELVLHVHANTHEELTLLLALVRDAGIRAVISAAGDCEKALIDASAELDRILVRLGTLEHLSYALVKLGTRFIPYASHADTPEALLGGWIRFKEVLWEALCSAYLPLARTGYELTSSAIEADAERLLGGNLMELIEY